MVAETTYQAIRARQQREPEVVEPAVVLLADPDHQGEVTDEMRRMAATLADQRDAAVETFLANALPSREVTDRVQLERSAHDRVRPPAPSAARPDHRL